MLLHVHEDTALFPDYSARKRYVNNNNIPQEGEKKNPMIMNPKCTLVRHWWCQKQ